MGTVEGFGGYGGWVRWVRWVQARWTVGAVEGGYRRMVEKYKDEGRKVQMAALTGGRYLGTCRNRIGEF